MNISHSTQHTSIADDNIKALSVACGVEIYIYRVFYLLILRSGGSSPQVHSQFLGDLPVNKFENWSTFVKVITKCCFILGPTIYE